MKDLKVGDKIFCIKDYNVIDKKDYNAIDKKIRNLMLEMNNKDYSELTEEEKKEYLNFNLNKIEYTTTPQYIKGKTYSIVSKLGPEIIIKGEEYSQSISLSNEKHRDMKNLKFLEEYFVSFAEGRKIKLNELSDITFSDFLNKIKNK